MSTQVLDYAAAKDKFDAVLRDFFNDDERAAIRRFIEATRTHIMNEAMNAHIRAARHSIGRRRERNTNPGTAAVDNQYSDNEAQFNALLERLGPDDRQAVLDFLELERGRAREDGRSSIQGWRSPLQLTRQDGSPTPDKEIDFNLQ